MHPGIKVSGPGSHLSPVWRRPNLPRLTTVISQVLPSEGRGREFESRRVRQPYQSVMTAYRARFWDQGNA